jgi:hypothetical protein
VTRGGGRHGRLAEGRGTAFAGEPREEEKQKTPNHPKSPPKPHAATRIPFPCATKSGPGASQHIHSTTQHGASSHGPCGTQTAPKWLSTSPLPHTHATARGRFLTTHTTYVLLLPSVSPPPRTDVPQLDGPRCRHADGPSTERQLVGRHGHGQRVGGHGSHLALPANLQRLGGRLGRGWGCLTPCWASREHRQRMGHTHRGMVGHARKMKVSYKDGWW